MWKLLIGAALGYAAGRSSRGEGSTLRPAVKAALRTGVRTFEKGTEAMAHLRESFEDIAAEVRSDLEEQAAAERARAREESEVGEAAPRRQANRRSSKRNPQQEVENHAPASHR